MRKSLLIIGILLVLIIGVILTSPLWTKSLILYFIEKSFGGQVKVEEVNFVFPNKIYAGNLSIGNEIVLAKVGVSVGNIFNLSPINIELIKPKIVIIHDEKGEWTFPTIPGLQRPSGTSTTLNVEIRAKIKDGIVIVRDLKTKKDITIPKVNGNLSFKDQKIAYTATAILSEERIGSTGIYNFSENSGSLSFDFKNANAKDWAHLFILDFFLIDSGKFTGNISVSGKGKDWFTKGNIDAQDVKIRLKDSDLSLENTETSISIDKHGIRINKGQGNWEGAVINFSGEIMPEFSLDLSIKDLDLSKIDKIYFSNSLALIGKGEGSLKILGKLETPNILGKFFIKQGSISNLLFSNLEISSDSLFPKLNIKMSTLLASGKLEGSLEYDLNKSQGNIYLKGENIPIQNFVKPFNLPPLEGIASLEVKGSKEKIWKFTVVGEVYEGKLGEYSAEKINFSFEGESDLNFFSLNR
ncbi:MAG: hypothetical protein ACPLKX_05425 [Dictyoglomaceae bacterium]